MSSGAFLPIRAGIDEAGLGPLLGPLCLGWSAIQVAKPSDEAWAAWAPLVARETPKRNASAHLVVADSKKVFARNERGRARLERTALAFLAQALPEASPPKTLGELLSAPIAPLGPRPEAQRAPWYAAARDLPLAQHADAGGLELLAERLRRTIAASPVKLAAAGLRIVPALELNASYAVTENKGTTMLAMTFDVLAHLWERFGERGIDVVVDRQGGRAHYGPALARRFPSANVQLIEERKGTSAYQLTSRESSAVMAVSFTEKGEDHSFTTALGSCLAKFARESMMRAFNQHFQAQDAALEPTAGYTTDGRRFLRDAKHLLAGLDSKLLVRDR